MVADRGAIPSLMTGFTPFFKFELFLVIPGTLVILLIALLLTGEK